MDNKKIELLVKYIRLANENSNDNEANLAARRACKLIKELNYPITGYVDNTGPRFNPPPPQSRPTTVEDIVDDLFGRARGYDSGPFSGSGWENFYGGARGGGKTKTAEQKINEERERAARVRQEEFKRDQQKRREEEERRNEHRRAEERRRNAEAANAESQRQRSSEEYKYAQRVYEQRYQTKWNDEFYFDMDARQDFEEIYKKIVEDKRRYDKEQEVKYKPFSSNPDVNWFDPFEGIKDTPREAMSKTVVCGICKAKVKVNATMHFPLGFICVMCQNKMRG